MARALAELKKRLHQRWLDENRPDLDDMKDPREESLEQDRMQEKYGSEQSDESCQNCGVCDGIYEVELFNKWGDEHTYFFCGDGCEGQWMRENKMSYDVDEYDSEYIKNLVAQQPKRPPQDYSLLKQEDLIGVPGFKTREQRQAFIDRAKRKKAKMNMSAESFKPPQSAVNNAKRGLELRKKWGRGGLSPSEAKSHGIDSGVTRARKIASGKVSTHDVRRMSAFNRHRKNYRPEKKMPDGGPTAGTIAWLLWGGTSGVNWAKKKSAAMNAESFEAEWHDEIAHPYFESPCPECGELVSPSQIEDSGFSLRISYYCDCNDVLFENEEVSMTDWENWEGDLPEIYPHRQPRPGSTRGGTMPITGPDFAAYRKEKRKRKKESSPTLTVIKVESVGGTRIPMDQVTFENGLVAGYPSSKNAKVGDRFVVATFDGMFPKIMDAEGYGVGEVWMSEDSYDEVRELGCPICSHSLKTVSASAECPMCEVLWHYHQDDGFSYFEAEGDFGDEFAVEFDDWADQEMMTHGKDVSFQEWADEEGEKHGDMNLVDWAKDEEKSHDKRYEAEEFCAECGCSHGEISEEFGAEEFGAETSSGTQVFNSCWKCGSGLHLYQIIRYPATPGQIAGVGGDPSESKVKDKEE